MSVVAGDILKLVVSLAWTDGAIMQNVYNAVVTGAGSPFDDEDIVDDAGDWATAMYDNLDANISDNLEGSQVQVYVYDAIDDDWDEVGSQSWTFAGVGVADQLPRANAALVIMKTTDPDVSGKKYIPGATTGAVDNGQLSVGFVANLVSYAVDWLSDFVGTTSGATWTPGVWSVVDTVFKAAASTAIINTIVAYQRRRKRGIGI
jgi:hypothetical protein